MEEEGDQSHLLPLVPREYYLKCDDLYCLKCDDLYYVKSDDLYYLKCDDV